ncbi:MAG TPA: hypothetical protein PKA15_03535 [Chitinophagales bacterium]|nr:hypothetical protein [Chitinophagales bacterium]HMY41898.1 hypothetical protein [Chitinophagales bacterium]
MAGRCKACNSILTEQELKTKYIGTNTYTELCDKCSDISDEYYDILEYIDINTISSKDILNDN